jgi:gluconolactonase
MALYPRNYFKPLAGGLDHPEGVAYGPDGFVYAGGEAGQIYRVGLDGKVMQVGTTGGFNLGLALDADANIYVCDMARAAVMRMTPGGEVSVYCEECEGARIKTPNYPCFDARGNLYVSDSGTHNGSDGKIYLIRPGGRAELFSAEAHVFTNGLCLSPNGSYIYVVESELPGISRIPILPGEKAGPCEPVIQLPPDDVPDGIAFDAGGRLYISCYAPNRIYRLESDGRLAVVVDDPTALNLSQCTNIAFAGPELDILLIASLSGWSIAAGKIDARGAALPCPRL